MTADEVRKYIDNKIKEKGLSYKYVSNYLQRSEAYIQQYIQYKRPVRLAEAERKKLARLLDEDEQNLTDIKLSLNPKELNNLVSIDPADLEGLDFKTEKNPAKLIAIDKDFIANFLPENPDVKYIKIFDDAMSKNLPRGSVAFIDINSNKVEKTGIYAFKINGQYIIRNVVLDPFNSQIIISSDDNSLPPLILKTLENVEIYGRVVACFRFF